MMGPGLVGSRPLGLPARPPPTTLASKSLMVTTVTAGKPKPRFAHFLQIPPGPGRKLYLIPKRNQSLLRSFKVSGCKVMGDRVKGQAQAAAVSGPSRTWWVPRQPLVPPPDSLRPTSSSLVQSGWNLPALLPPAKRTVTMGTLAPAQLRCGRSASPSRGPLPSPKGQTACQERSGLIKHHPAMSK